MPRRRLPPDDFIPQSNRLSDFVPGLDAPLATRSDGGRARTADRMVVPSGAESNDIVTRPRVGRPRVTSAHDSSPALREAFRLAVARTPAAEWPAAARDAYNDYVRQRRAARHYQSGMVARPDRPPALEQAFQLMARRVPASEWPPEAREAYNTYQRERRRQRSG